MEIGKENEVTMRGCECRRVVLICEYRVIEGMSVGIVGKKRLMNDKFGVGKYR